MFSDWIRELERKGMKLQDIADIIDVSYQTIQCYRDKGNYPKVENLMKFAKYFNVSTDYILGIEIKEKKRNTEEEEYMLNLYNELNVPNKREVENLAKKLGEEQAKNKEKIS